MFVLLERPAGNQSAQISSDSSSVLDGFFKKRINTAVGDHVFVMTGRISQFGF